MKFIPYLYFTDQAEEAMRFYADVLNGEIISKSKYSEGPEGMDIPPDMSDKIMHGAVKCEAGLLYFSDGPGINKGNQVALSIDCDSEDQIDRIYKNLSEGGKIFMPLAKQFWGAKYGKFTDKFGINWDLNYTYPQEPEREYID